MPIRHIPFFPDPIRGQALLDNFKRTLRYSCCGKSEAQTIPRFQHRRIKELAHRTHLSLDVVWAFLQ